MKTEQVASSQRTLSTEEGETMDVSQPGVIAIGITNPQVAELFAFALHSARVPLRVDHVPPMTSPLLQQMGKTVCGQTIFIIEDRDVPAGVDLLLLLDAARRLLRAIEGGKPGSSPGSSPNEASPPDEPLDYREAMQRCGMGRYIETGDPALTDRLIFALRQHTPRCSFTVCQRPGPERLHVSSNAFDALVAEGVIDADGLMK